jgi:hypothetical protein
MPTYALYHKGENGLLRVGTFRSSRGSVRNICAGLKKQMPNLDIENCLIAPRVWLMGKWVDGDLVRAEL